MLRCLIILCGLVLLNSCGGDFDLEKITAIESQQSNLAGDGSTYFYYGGQVTRPVPPADITPADTVELSFVVIYREGPSNEVPTKLMWHLKGAADLSLPDIRGGADLTYVPAPPPATVAPEIWCIFNNCLAMFTEAEFAAGDYYYAVITIDVGTLPVGTHIFEMMLDEDDDYTPADIPPTENKRSTVFVTVASTVIASK